MGTQPTSQAPKSEAPGAPCLYSEILRSLIWTMGSMSV
jgi:hypothetical protein